MAKLDTDESGAVDKDEYRRYVEKKHEWTSDDWAPVFAKFDAVGRCKLKHGLKRVESRVESA
jgi:hypothetical protein